MATKVGDAYVDITTELDDGKAVVDLRKVALKLKAQARASKVTFPVDLDTHTAESRIKSFEQALRRVRNEGNKPFTPFSKLDTTVYHREVDRVNSSIRKRFVLAAERTGREAGQRTATKMAENLLSILPGRLELLFTRSGPIGAAIGTGLLAIAVWAGGLFVSMLGSVILAATGVGAIVAGIAAAFVSSKELQSAAATVGSRFVEQFKKIGQSFLRPTYSSIKLVEEALTRMGPRISNTFAKIAPLTQNLTKGLVGLAERALPGVLKAVSASRPLIQTLADKLPELGQALSEFFTKLAMIAPELNAAFAFTLDIVKVLIDLFGDAIVNATRFFKGVREATAFGLEGIARFLDLVEKIPQVFAASLGPVGQALEAILHAASKIPGVGGKFKEAAEAASGLSTKFHGMADNVRNAGSSVQTLANTDLPALIGQFGLAQVSAERQKTIMSGVKDTLKNVGDRGNFAKEGIRQLTESMTHNHQFADVFSSDFANATGQVLSTRDAVNNLRDSLRNLHDQQAGVMDGNRNYEASLDSLQSALKANGGTLSEHTAEGRANQEALKGATEASLELMLQDIKSGVPIEEATKRHEKRTKRLYDETVAAGGTKKETQGVIDTYGKVPRDVRTILELSGVGAVLDEMATMLAAQQAAKEGVPLTPANVKKYKDLLTGQADINTHTQHSRDEHRRASGGRVWGPGGSTEDRIPASVDGGPPIWRLSNDEHVWSSKEVAAVGGHQKMEELRAAARAGAFQRAQGGAVSWPFKIDVSKTLIDKEWLERVKAQYAGDGQFAFGNGVGDNSVRAIVALANKTGEPFQVTSTVRSLGSPGSPTADYHTTGNAVDFVENSAEGMARFASKIYQYAPYLLEEIHSGGKGYFVKKGQRVGRDFYGGAVVSGHYDHVHVAATKEGANAARLGKPVPSGGRGGNHPAASSQLREWILTALKKTGNPSNWLGPMTTLVMRESSGNPRTVNTWDSNAAAGHPSKGLAQTIGPTFNSYHEPGTSWDIFDPVANLSAALNYIRARYGSIYNVQQADPNKPPRGYASGTTGAAPGWAWVGEKGGELVNFHGGEQVLSHSDSMTAISDIGGYAKGTLTEAQKRRIAEQKAFDRRLHAVLRSISRNLEKFTGTAKQMASASASLRSTLRSQDFPKRAKREARRDNRLIAAGQKRDALRKKIKTAKDFAVDKRQDLIEYAQLSSLDLPDVYPGKKNTLGQVISALTRKRDRALLFSRQVRTLGNRGLSKRLIGQVIESGPDSDIARILQSAGPDEIRQLNRLSKSIGTGATTFGKNVSDALYDSGKQAAKGFLTGLRGQEKVMNKQITRLARELLNSIRKSFGLRPVKYDTGGLLLPGRHFYENNTGRPEFVFTEEQMSTHLGGDTEVYVMIDGRVLDEVVDYRIEKKSKKSTTRIGQGRTRR